ncbi:helical backbone metal receptor [Tepidimonas taiwanensis]|uniref:Vitamin B12-binding protein n=1 Tax=Tepidimonas taiwanensis TaxID=307486 RepID=A0A554XD99_9BURK|nr:helical backbone metal receptor [Tepidimonas taiwanensis]MCX7691855.1 helical backbone metal receptor [Tepidimonas taiwanensis]MDM7463159.1 helical backbone metal receptor [Tepidimonas taiwanensis]TSE33806.1 Vitamin B12-binding protein [Tepidimonas taiwanensis]UBQ06656.1 helical backbone metal receptor [Tepidimonas taiwanensis]
MTLGVGWRDWHRKRPNARAWRACWLAVCWLALAPLLRAQVVVTDDQGVSVRLAQPPQRIVSLLPSLAETVCELGQCHRLVGVDRYTNWPAVLRDVPRVGGGLDPHIERIVALRPDVVLLATSSRAGERLRALGIPVVALEPKTHADVQRVLLRIGALLQVSDPLRVWQSIDAAVTAAARSLPDHARGVRVYVEVSPGPYAAGEASFIGETLARLGVRNVVPASMGPFPKLNPEWVVRADPDVIVVGARSAVDLLQRPGWGAMRALRGGHFCVLTPADSDVLLRPGPRMGEAAAILARCLASKAPRDPGGRS